MRIKVPFNTMRKVVLILLVIAFAFSFSYSQEKALADDNDEISQMTIVELYDYLQLLDCEEAQNIVDMLSEEQGKALEEYMLSLEETEPEISEDNADEILKPDEINNDENDVNQQENMGDTETETSEDETHEDIKQEETNKEEENEEEINQEEANEVENTENDTETPKKIDENKKEQTTDGIADQEEISNECDDLKAKTSKEQDETDNNDNESKDENNEPVEESDDETKDNTSQDEIDKENNIDEYRNEEETSKLFVKMTVQEQYEYLLTIDDEKETEKLLSLLNEEQIEAITEYGLTVEDSKSSNDDLKSLEFEIMTVQEQYEYLLTRDSFDEIQIELDKLSPEQVEELDKYISLQETIKEEFAQKAIAIDYTNAAPFVKPVNIFSAMKAFNACAQKATSTDEDDALVVDKYISGSDGDYIITIESYATGEVEITTSETPVPADIILVLDTSGSMEDGIQSGEMASREFAYNYEAYNFSEDNELYVLDGGNYYRVQIDRSNSYKYTYRYEVNGQIVTHESGNYGWYQSPPNWNFRYPNTITRMSALKSAANNFIDAVNEKANATTNGVDHRIAVVRFASGCSIISGNGSANGAFVDVYNNASSINDLKSAINGLNPDGATRADYGMGKAKDIFQQDLPDASGERNRVVIFFTDGTPTSSNQFDYSVANGAISHANTLKKDTSSSGYGATVYSIGIFDGANPTEALSSTSNENKFMHYISTNYLNASSMSTGGTGSNDGYYLSASSSEALNSIFQSISNEIQTGGTTITLDESSVIKDIITPYFGIVDVNGINVSVSQAHPDTGEWQIAQAYPEGIVNVDSDGRTIRISGFDYADNYYAAIETNGTITGYQGKKLIVEIPIEYIEGSCFGGRVPTNDDESGIYNDGTLVENLPVPMVDIPVNYDYIPSDKSIYISQLAQLDNLFGAHADYIADGINNAYVDIVYTVKNAQNEVLGIYTISSGEVSGTWNNSNLLISGLCENTEYNISCKVTPNTDEINPLTIDKAANVYVWTPKLKFKDSVIYYGETADYSDNFVSTQWINADNSADMPSGDAPSVELTYSVAEAAFAIDTIVAVRTHINGWDITDYAMFLHQVCNEPNCSFDPSVGQFMVHVKTCSLTIEKSGAVDESDTFIFTVTGNGISLKIALQGNSSRTIVGLPVGEYTIVEDADWSWRYLASDKSVVLSSSNPSQEVIMQNGLTNNQWLSGDSHVENVFTGH